ncbi:MAG: hypothetical protein KIS94_13625 [Chitinophagales bacterium]|nr:hypothetical protein [Chitinophagales bacterium]
MKSFFWLSIAGCMIGLFGCNECEDESTKTNAVFVIIDYTDSLNYSWLKKTWRKDVEQISKIFDLNVPQPCTAGSFRVVPIVNVGERPGTVLYHDFLPPDVDPFTIPQDAIDLVTNIPKVIQHHLGDSVSSLRRTCYFEPTCKALVKLANIKKGRRIVILYSDLLENSDLYRTYNRPFSLTEDSLTEIQAKCHCTLPDLTGIEIYVVNHRNEATDHLIRDNNAFWKSVFENRNATVMIGSNLELTK